MRRAGETVKEIAGPVDVNGVQYSPPVDWVREAASKRERGHGLAVVGAVGWALVLGWFAFVKGDKVPLLSLVDLGFHELGHLVTYPLPWDGVTAAMGSVAQVGVPLGIAVYFWWVRTDHLGASVCLAWAAAAAKDVSVYIADAPYEQLELIGGDHDFAFLLAAHLDRAAPLARTVSTAAGVLLFGALVLALSVPYLEYRKHHRGERPPLKIRYLD